MPLDREQVLSALRSVKDSVSGKDLVSTNRIKEVRVAGAAVYVKVELRSPNDSNRNVIERDILVAAKSIGGVDVTVEFVAAPANPPTVAPSNNPLPQIKNVVAVGAGKGGVGKSTIALNLAVGLQRTGLQVGLMDGDIYGPSMPTMLGVRGATPTVSGNKILPHHVHGIYAVTIGSLVEQDKPLIWRGPMAHGAFKQLLLDNTTWPALDFLIVDLPPGTGDVPLSLCQLLPLTGAVVVATPQQVALDDALRAVRMFQQLGAPILGVVENMSYMPLPDGSSIDLYGRGGTEKMAEQMDLPFLGAVPMVRELRINSDQGKPHANFEEPLLHDALNTIVANLVAQVGKRNQEQKVTLTIS
ncbi:MAG: Mrp/NBP35 family ATP-binding protein [Phycisphaerae bacterium]|nr:Mrp/NBP35 family ATP-binding protein [Phycisphaerae bacterium]